MSALRLKLSWFFGAAFFTACTLEPIFLRDDTAFACSELSQCSQGFVCHEAICRPENSVPDAGSGCGITVDCAAPRTDAGFD